MNAQTENADDAPIQRLAGRVVRAEKKSKNGEVRRVRMVAATDDYVRMWDGWESLTLTRDAVDTTEFRYFMSSHREDDADRIIGTIAEVVFDEGRMEVEAEVDPVANPRGERLLRMIDRGAEVPVSLGYRRTAERVVDGRIDGDMAFTTPRLAALEVSQVVRGADPGASVVRGSERLNKNIRHSEQDQKDTAMPSEEKPDKTESRQDAEKQDAKPQPSVDVNAVRAEVRQNNADILKLGDEYHERGVEGAKEKADEALRQGKDIEWLRGELRGLFDKSYDKLREGAEKRSKEVEVGLTPNEIEGFSFVRAIHAINEAQQGRPNAKCHELDVMRTTNDIINQRSARETASPYSIPGEVLRAGSEDAKRVMYAGQGAGENLVETALAADSFIEMLRASSVLTQRATSINDLVGDIEIPSQTTATTAHWRDEDDPDSALSDIGTAKLKLSPKELISVTQMSRRSLVQTTPDVEMLVRRDHAIQQGLAVDLAGFVGSNANGQPDGVFARDPANQGVVVSGELDRAGVIAMETKLAESNALMGNLAYMGVPAERQHAKTQAIDTGSGIFLYQDGLMNGYPFETTTQIPRTFNSVSARTGGAKDCVFFGNWMDVLIASWSGVDVIVNPYSEQKKAGIVVSMHRMVDVGLRHNESVVYTLFTKP